MKSISVKEAIATDPLVAIALEQIINGEISLSCGPMTVVWTEEDKDRLDEALIRAFGK